MSEKLPHVQAHEAICKFIGDMAKENEVLKQRIKRLEEAGDYLCAAAAFLGWHDKIDEWNKAKEAKL